MRQAPAWRAALERGPTVATGLGATPVRRCPDYDWVAADLARAGSARPLTWTSRSRWRTATSTWCRRRWWHRQRETPPAR